MEMEQEPDGAVRLAKPGANDDVDHECPKRKPCFFDRAQKLTFRIPDMGCGNGPAFEPEGGHEDGDE
ncbi:hypothetical protein [Methylobacterium sp. Leaf93]|uniref:hypothetical protein n=1 Tax=Methylobacterium sp. Leaf93 TaxID=1736249 RepID=UPI0006F4E51F|nr:hypothetical protein [Methylobacterium sp. Leaf93]KQP04524.1 hypothetical protein ASF26_10310 [Methylobacterium sp. Leaf93]